MQLYSEDFEEFLDVQDGYITIEAESQFQDLENYTIAQTYDLQLVNNELNAIILKGEDTTYNGKTIKKDYDADYFRVDLYNNGAPILRGRLVYQSSTPTSIKVVYQAVPFCDVFKNFIFRDKLKDYFINSDYYFDQLKFNWHIRDLFAQQQDLYLTIDSKRRIFGDVYYDLGIKFFNRTGDDAKSQHNPCNNHRETIDIHKKAYLFNDEHDYHPYLAKVNLFDLLYCMGLNLDRTDEWLKKDDYYFPLGVKVDKKFKVRLYQSDISVDDKYAKTITYRANDMSEISEWDETTNGWIGDDPTYDVGTPTWNFDGAFANTIRSGKAVKDMQIVDVLTKFDTAFETLQVDSDRLYNDYLLDLYEGKTYEEGEEFKPKLITYTKNTDYIAPYFDVIIKVTAEADYYTYQENREWMYSIPFNSLDLSFLDISTNEFLNGISLNGKRWTWLRNPLFVDPENASMIWGQNGSRDYSFLTDEDIISIERTDDTDANSYLRISMPVWAKSSAVKRLNDLGNEEKAITQTIIAYDYHNKVDMDSENFRSFPPIFFDNTKEVGEQLLENEIEGIIGYEEEGGFYDVNGNYKYKVYNFIADGTDVDYIDEYVDHSVKYTIKCTGYQMQDKIILNGDHKRKFAVGKYKTEDFVVFELEVYPYID